MTIEVLKTETVKLTKLEKLEFLQFLAETLSQEERSEILGTQKEKILRRRREEVKSEQVKTIPSKQVKAKTNLEIWAYSLDFHVEATYEFDEALAWYQEQKIGLEQDFFNEYLALESRLEATPHQFPIIFESIRRANFAAFPYSIFFEIEENAVFIYAVFHQKRDPTEWEDRL